LPAAGVTTSTEVVVDVLVTKVVEVGIVSVEVEMEAVTTVEVLSG
jgi:hypothetical protein